MARQGLHSTQLHLLISAWSTENGEQTIYCVILSCFLGTLEVAVQRRDQTTILGPVYRLFGWTTSAGGSGELFDMTARFLSFCLSCLRFGSERQRARGNSLSASSWRAQPPHALDGGLATAIIISNKKVERRKQNKSIERKRLEES